MSAQKRIKEFVQRSTRKLKHREGFGVHSPFAFDIITQVIEEKIPYYAYATMQPLYKDKGTPLPFKAACLLLRLANRFHVRHSLVMGDDQGHYILPLLMVDSRNKVQVLASDMQAARLHMNLAWTERQQRQLEVIHLLSDASAEARPSQQPSESIASDSTSCQSSQATPPDMVVVNCIPEGCTPESLAQWLIANTHESSIFFVHGIQPGHKLETLWDCLCSSQDIAITMDLYDYGLAIRKPRFYKQHYIVSF